MLLLFLVEYIIIALMGLCALGKTFFMTLDIQYLNN